MVFVVPLFLKLRAKLPSVPATTDTRLTLCTPAVLLTTTGTTDTDPTCVKSERSDVMSGIGRPPSAPVKVMSQPSCNCRSWLCQATLTTLDPKLDKAVCNAA